MPDSVVITLSGADTFCTGDPDSPAGEGRDGCCWLLKTGKSVGCWKLLAMEDGKTSCDGGTSGWLLCAECCPASDWRGLEEEL